jgi:carbamoylphosphate synthase small subunit
VDNAKAILGKKPVFGICMGHQILGQAFGGKTFKLKFGHHGGNHPIRYNPTGASTAAVVWCGLYVDCAVAVWCASQLKTDALSLLHGEVPSVTLSE